MIKIIWILWLQGWDKAPKICKKCLESWHHYNKDFQINKLNKSNLKKYINIDNFFSKVRKQ